MAHADHFLRRLDRVADHHVELSLTLYRDEALLKEVLSRAELPEGIGRLAISLDDPIEGPFIIVTREGRFVTCLAKGMLIGPDVGLLTRPRLDAAIAKVERMRERMAATIALRESDGEGVASRLFRRMAEDGLRFCREDAETLLQVWPLVGVAAVHVLVQLMRALRTYRKEVGYLRFDKLKPHEHDLAIAYGKLTSNASHLLVFCEHEASDGIIKFISDELDARFLGVQTLFELGTLSLGVRSLWVLAQRPKQYIAQLKALRDDPRMEMRQLRELGLGVIACASPKLRAEAMKALSRPIDEETPADLDPDERYLHIQLSAAGALGEAVRTALENEAEVDGMSLRAGEALAATFTTRRVPTQDECAAIPEPVARAVLANTAASWLGVVKGASHAPQLAYACPWLARARAEELFMPRAYADIIPVMGIEDVSDMMTNYGQSRGLTRSAPIKSAAKVGRNEACACGSGKKSKRCCEK